MELASGPYLISVYTGTLASLPRPVVWLGGADQALAVAHPGQHCPDSLRVGVRRCSSSDRSSTKRFPGAAVPGEVTGREAASCVFALPSEGSTGLREYFAELSVALADRLGASYRIRLSGNDRQARAAAREAALRRITDPGARIRCPQPMTGGEITGIESKGCRGHVCPLCSWSLVPMRHREDNILKNQASCEVRGLISPRNPMECGKSLLINGEMSTLLAIS